MITDVLIVGTGALATLFAARLTAAGKTVAMLGTWQEGLKALDSGGASVEGEGSYKVWATDDPLSCRGAKLALVLVKSWQTERVAHQLADCLAKDGLAITFQNGLGNDEILSRALGVERVERGITTLGATLVAAGSVRPTGRPVVTFEKKGKLDELENILRIANFEIQVVEDLVPIIWGKLVVNAAINPLTALLRVKNGDLLRNAPARELMIQLARETASVAEALGVALPFVIPERAVEEVAEQTSDNVSSMLQDVMRKSRTEIDYINGVVVKSGEQMRVSTPVNRIVWSLVKALENDGEI
jgi:2-dehydropantoate 2-reductase